MAFRNIIGHKTVVKLLKGALVNQRVSHAYLFAGPEGVGKEFTAIQFAKALNCLEEGEDSCDECRSCRKFASGNHPDFKIIRPVENSISIDQIRELQKDLVYKPYESQWKIYIIDQAHLMTSEGANSLLKTLEEPPRYAVIIMISSRKDGILPTIISRCQLIQFNKLSRNELREYFTKQDEISLKGQNLEEIVLLADGSIGQALKLLKDDQIWDRRNTILKFLLNLNDKTNLEIYEMIQTLEMDRDLSLWEEIFKIIKTFYRDLLILKNINSKEHLINQSYFKEMQKCMEHYSTEDLERVIKLIERTNNVIMTNVNRELALEVMLHKIKARRM
ncbi:DNA polymerase III subunit delta' [Anoxybacter fermentans]|uniref:DNA polymerase III subunit delta' n=1 Tax=Anoxybacter fermentans TaxID=1323375 RepID=A0A3S9T1C9_9FIRM|nr:DNA polymerase III subunit delta' [Anoxybacter fermentans]AZR74416.1 DNA polymerase III subunit delta' [Anoxybacter fermentans]